MSRITIDFIVLAIAIVIGFFYLKKDKPYLKIFPFFLLLTLAVELTGQYFQKPGQSNLILFNFFSVLEFCFYIYFFRESIPGERIRKRINIILYLTPVVCLLNIFLVQGTNQFHTYTYSAGCLLMVALGITYFYRLFKTEEQIDLLREPSFWISIGIIFFFICTLSMLGVINYVGQLPMSIRANIKSIIKLINAFFYLFFIIGFLCRNTRRSSSRQ
jgi:ABC-type transport system involved in cytochrome c biogenesis permease subunit